MRLGELVIDTTPLRQSSQFRLVLAGRGVVLLAAGLIAVAVTVQVYSLTRSSLQVALVNVVLATSLLVGFLVGGVLADRVDRRRLILVAGVGIVLAFVVFAVNAAVASPHQLAVIYLTTALGAAVEGVGETALSAVIPTLVTPEQLAAASGLIAVTSQLGAVAGPAVGGLLAGGPGLAVTYGAAAGCSAVTTVLFMRLRPLPVGGERPADPDHDTDPGPAADAVPQPGAWASIVEGFAFVRGNRLIAGVLLIDLCATVFGVPGALFPQLAAEVFDGGPELVGLLNAAPAAGALLASLASGWTGRVRRTGIALLWSVVAIGVGYVGLGLSTHLAVALLFLAVAGGADTISEILRRALLQYHTPDALQGRVNSLWLAQANTSYSVGGVAAGVAARLVGPAGAVVAAGALCLASVAVLTAALPALRRASLNTPAHRAEPGTVPDRMRR